MKFSDVLIKTLRGEQGKTDLKTPRIVRNAHYSFVDPDPLPNPKLIATSKSLLSETLNLNLSDQEILGYFSGNVKIPGSPPCWALNYGGHQFGSYAGQLGDGRTISLCQVVNDRSEICELQLKGSGMTPYSRFADGLAVLRSSVREYICSEAMHHLKVPTSRALSLIFSNKPVQREVVETAAVVCRVAPSWIRFGSFELLYYRNEEENLKTLADYCIENFFPSIKKGQYSDWFKKVCELTAIMISKWQAVGFCHGVMNTDNFSVLGITIDYGPFQFMDRFEKDYICNHSDEMGMYSYSNQPKIGFFNLTKLATAIVPLLKTEFEEIKQIEDSLIASLHYYTNIQEENYEKLMMKKIGLKYSKDSFDALIPPLLEILEKTKSDYTLFFRALCMHEPKNEICYADFIDNPSQADIFEFQPWFSLYNAALVLEQTAGREQEMKNENPMFIPRNFLLARIIENCERGEYEMFHSYMKVLEEPFDDGTVEDRRRFGGMVPVNELNIKCSCSS